MGIRFFWALGCVFAGLLLGGAVGQFLISLFADISIPRFNISIPYLNWTPIKPSHEYLTQSSKAFVAAACTLWGLANQDDIKSLAKSFSDRQSKLYWTKRGFLPTSARTVTYSAAAACGAMMMISFAAPSTTYVRTLDFWVASPASSDWREFRRVAWHFYFGAGSLDQESAGVDSDGNCTGELSKSGETFRHNNSAWSDEEVVKSLESIIRSVAACHGPEKSEAVRLSLRVSASSATWKVVNPESGAASICMNSEELNERQKSARAGKMDKLFKMAKANLAENQMVDAGFLRDVDLPETDKSIAFDFDDKVFELKRTDASKLSDIEDTPYPIGQSAVIFLENPGICQKLEEKT